MKKITFCEICGSQTKFGGKTCSRKCSDELKKRNNREIRKCKVCGKNFEVKKTTKKEMCSYECRKIWAKIPENKNNRIKKSQEAIQKKHGVKSVFELESVKQKSKQTKKERYGNEIFVNVKKAKQTKKERYGNENYNNVSKSKKTKKERYGDENYNNREAAEKTMKDEYGVSHAMKLKKIQNKAAQTNIKKYNFKFPMQNEEIKKKAKQTSLERYNTQYPTRLPKIKEKIRKSYYKKFKKTKMFKELQIKNLKLIGEYSSRTYSEKGERINNIYKFECLDCGNIFSATFANNTVPPCRKCYPMYKNNKHQIELSNFLNSLKIKFEENNKSIIAPFELDFFIEELNIAIEINGNYWHSEIAGEKSNKYHLKKSKLCKEKNIKLIHIFEDEFILKKNIVKSRLVNILNHSTQKIYARNCDIKTINNATKKDFLEKNHIQGNSVDYIRIGLFHKNKLVSVMAFSKKRIALGNKSSLKGEYELSRFCSKNNINVIGGFNKLLNYFVKNYNPYKIISYADCRWSGLNPEQTVYYKNKFTFISYTKPSYWYFLKNDYIKRYHRFSFNKQKLLSLVEIKNKNNYTEWELARILKMDRIWDCGAMKFELNLTKKGD